MVEKIKDIVYKAGALIEHAGEITNEEAQTKPGSANYVTQYDMLVRQFLIEQLQKAFPNAAFVGEEGEYAANKVGDGEVFVIDPVDGTTNFMCDMQYSGISVALVRDGEACAAVVYNPFRKEMFWAQTGKGAFLNDKPLHITDRTLEKGVVNFGTAPYNIALRDDAFALAKAVSYYTMDLREMGSASLSLCFTAANRCVAYYSPQLCAWDYAAAQLIIEQAGGVVCRIDGASPKYASKVEIVAGAPAAVAQFREIARSQKEASHHF